MNCSYNYDKNYEIYLKTPLTLEVTQGGIFFEKPGRKSASSAQTDGRVTTRRLLYTGVNMGQFDV